MRPWWPPTWNQPWTGLLVDGGVAETGVTQLGVPGAIPEARRAGARSASPLASRGTQDTAPAPGPVPVCHSLPVSAGKLALGVGAVALVVVVVLGVSQASKDTAAPPKPTALTRAEIRQRLDGAPPALASLHRQANEILPGARKGLRTRLAELRGHPAVVNIWAAWCGPCRAEMPVMQRVSLGMGTQG